MMNPHSVVMTFAVWTIEILVTLEDVGKRDIFEADLYPA
jgi:hypothetical protein